MSHSRIGCVWPSWQRGIIITIFPSIEPQAAASPTTEHVPALRIRLFGRMQVDDGAGRSVLPRSRKTRALLAILALAPNQTVLRSQVTALLWSLREKEQGLASLRQALHELQQALGAARLGLLRADRNHLALQDACFWVDALAFMSATPSHPEPLSLFCGLLVEDLQGVDPAFDCWLTDQNERLTRIARKIGETILAEQDRWVWDSEGCRATVENRSGA